MNNIKRNLEETNTHIMTSRKRPRSNAREDSVESRVHILTMNRSEGVVNQGYAHGLKRGAEEISAQNTMPSSKYQMIEADAREHMPIIRAGSRMCQSIVERVSDVYAGKISMVIVQDAHSLITYLTLNNDMELMRIFRPIIEARDHTGCTALVQMTKRGDLERVQQLRQVGANIEAQDQAGLTALMLAAENHDIELVKKLQKVGANIEAKDHAGCTSLMRAAANHDFELVRALWNLGANLEAQDNEGFTALMRAVENNDFSLVSHLCDLGLKVETKTLKKVERELQIMLARCKALDSKLHEIKNAFESNNQNNAVSIIQQALNEQRNFKGSVSIEPVSQNIDYTTNCYEFFTLLHTTLNEQTIPYQIIEYIKKEDIETLSLFWQLLELQTSWRKHSIHISSQITCRGANIEARDHKGHTALMRAVDADNMSMVQLLVQLGANIEAKDHEGFTALMRAVDADKMSMVRLLVQLDADIEAKNNDGRTALMYAAIICQKTEVVRELHEMGAEIDAHGLDGRTALSSLFASYTDDKTMPMIFLLQKLGADREFAEELLSRVFLAHVMGISAKSNLTNKTTKKIVEIDLEGMGHIYAMNKLIQCVKTFLHSSSCPPEKQEMFINILKATVFDIEDIEQGLRNFHAGKPVVISGGSVDHRISMVLRKDPRNKNTAQLIICNRGDGRGENAVEHYALPVSDVTEELLGKLITQYEDIEDFNDEIADLNMTNEGHFNQKTQKAGTCAWASLKGAFGILCRLYVGKDPIEGNTAYKAFTKHSRQMAVAWYEKYSQRPGAQPDLALLKTCKEKLEKKFSKQIVPTPTAAT